jgi:hypothetical protein
MIDKSAGQEGEGTKNRSGAIIRRLIYLLAMLGLLLICLLVGYSYYRMVNTAYQPKLLPQVVATGTANYQPQKEVTPFQPLSREIIRSILKDNAPLDQDITDRLLAVEQSLRIPVPTATGGGPSIQSPASTARPPSPALTSPASTPAVQTAAATAVAATAIPRPTSLATAVVPTSLSTRVIIVYPTAVPPPPPEPTDGPVVEPPVGPTVTATFPLPPTLTNTPVVASTLHAGSMTGSTSDSGSHWVAHMSIIVHNQNHNPVANVLVTGMWSESGTGNPNGSCTTGPTGTCTIDTSPISDSVTSTTFTLKNNGLRLSGYTYNASANHGVSACPGAGCDSITISQ